MNIGQIKKDVHFLLGSTSATYFDLDITRNINIAYQDVTRLIWESDGGWAFDDSNNTDSPKATKTLGNLSGTYTIPTTALRIEQVEIKDNGGNWSKLNPISYHEITTSPESYQSQGGLPTEYALEGNEIRLFPPPFSGNVTLVSGMALRLSRAVTEFAASASSTTPGFATSFHRILSYGAAVDFTQDQNQRQNFLLLKQRLEQGLVRFYGKRAEENPTGINPATKKRWRNYL